MPYYCTVPRCTSMAGKTKNVSFHQFPRDEQLACLWNKILKRGKPYTKYSKVCSLHFRPEDYTITSVGKNKGQWRTLRKDAIPSQNLPSECPIAARRNSLAWVPAMPNEMVNPTMQQQVAQAIYMQTMLSMQAASNGVLPTQSNAGTPDTSQTSKITISDLERLLKQTPKSIDTDKLKADGQTSFKCLECSKCFKDPDVFLLHRRSHNKTDQLTDNISSSVEKENLNSNSDFKQATLQANPILANLLKSEVPNANMVEANNVLSIENQIMTALTANMEAYLRNLTSMLTQRSFVEQDAENNSYSSNDDECQEAMELQAGHDSEDFRDSSRDCHDSNRGNHDSNQDCHDSNRDCHDSNQDCHDSSRDCQDPSKKGQESDHQESDNLVQDYSMQESSNSNMIESLEEKQDRLSRTNNSMKTQSKMDGFNFNGPLCDNEDLNNSKESINLVIDENA